MRPSKPCFVWSISQRVRWAFCPQREDRPCGWVISSLFSQAMQCMSGDFIHKGLHRDTELFCGGLTVGLVLCCSEMGVNRGRSRPDRLLGVPCLPCPSLIVSCSVGLRDLGDPCKNSPCEHVIHIFLISLVPLKFDKVLILKCTYIVTENSIKNSFLLVEMYFFFFSKYFILMSCKQLTVCVWGKKRIPKRTISDHLLGKKSFNAC